MESDTTKFIATILFSIIVIATGVAHLIASPLGWKRFRHSFFTVIFLSEKRWDQPIAKVFNIAWALIQYSVGFWMLVTKVF